MFNTFMAVCVSGDMHCYNLNCWHFLRTSTFTLTFCIVMISWVGEKEQPLGCVHPRAASRGMFLFLGHSFKLWCFCVCTSVVHFSLCTTTVQQVVLWLMETKHCAEQYLGCGYKVPSPEECASSLRMLSHQVASCMWDFAGNRNITVVTGLRNSGPVTIQLIGRCWNAPRLLPLDGLLQRIW